MRVILMQDYPSTPGGCKHREGAWCMMSAAVTAVRYSAKFPGRPEQAAKVRRAVAGCLSGCPASDDMVLIASELATNAIRHSASKSAFFTVRVEVLPGG